MTPLFKKLNFKDQPSIFAINSPDSFQVELDGMSQFTTIKKSCGSSDQVHFAIVFVTEKKQIKEFVSELFNQFIGDANIWLCYPKGSSKKYKCDFNRDNGWDEIGLFNLEPVRQVSIDKDWSALRFRKTEYIKKLTRSKDFAISPEGKKRTKGK